jgi:hypothetical protein
VPQRARNESLADRVLSVVALVGAVGGAVGGTVLGAETGFPIVCGTLGTMLGSSLAVSGWYLIVRLWTNVPATVV